MLDVTRELGYQIGDVEEQKSKRRDSISKQLEIEWNKCDIKVRRM